VRSACSREENGGAAGAPEAGGRIRDTSATSHSRQVVGQARAGAGAAGQRPVGVSELCRSWPVGPNAVGVVGCAAPAGVPAEWQAVVSAAAAAASRWELGALAAGATAHPLAGVVAEPAAGDAGTDASAAAGATAAERLAAAAGLPPARRADGAAAGATAADRLAAAAGLPPARRADRASKVLASRCSRRTCCPPYPCSRARVVRTVTAVQLLCWSGFAGGEIVFA